MKIAPEFFTLLGKLDPNTMQWHRPYISLLVTHKTSHSNFKQNFNIIKLFKVVIYCHFKVIMSFCVIKLHYQGNCCGMAVNDHGICVTNVLKHNLTLNGTSILGYDSKILWHFNPRKIRVKITSVIYCGILITLAPGLQTTPPQKGAECKCIVVQPTSME